MTHPILPKITLVGAGPGDPELITIKGLRALQQADAILYDALVNPILLKEAKPHVPLVYVGKRAGSHSHTQESINLLLVQYAFNYGNVVRLKGGDPFVFGRGYEELEYAYAMGIATEVIPGLSSSVALPGLEKVPLTSRGYSNSFWVITGSTQNGNLPDDLVLAAHSQATVVILMGMDKLDLIARIFSQHSKANTPAMLIQNGSLPHQRIALGTAATLPQIALQHQIGAPGIIVIGNTVKLHPHYEHLVSHISQTA